MAETNSRRAKVVAICESATQSEQLTMEVLEMEASVQDLVNQDRVNAEIEVVNAPLNYLAEATPKPVNYTYEPPAGMPRQSGKYIKQTVAIRNGREVPEGLSLDINGFVLTPHETAVKDFYDPDEVRAVYYPEVERLLKRMTG